MNHDPLCDVVIKNEGSAWEKYYPIVCVCDLIARVREDEHENDDSHLAAYMLGERAGYAAALRDAAEAVKAALTDDDGYVRQSELDDAVAAIERLGGER